MLTDVPRRALYRFVYYVTFVPATSGQLTIVLQMYETISMPNLQTNRDCCAAAGAASVPDHTCIAYVRFRLVCDTVASLDARHSLAS